MTMYKRITIINETNLFHHCFLFKMDQNLELWYIDITFVITLSTIDVVFWSFFFLLLLRKYSYIHRVGNICLKSFLFCLIKNLEWCICWSIRKVVPSHSRQNKHMGNFLKKILSGRNERTYAHVPLYYILYSLDHTLFCYNFIKFYIMEGHSVVLASIHFPWCFIWFRKEVLNKNMN